MSKADDMFKKLGYDEKTEFINFILFILDEFKNNIDTDIYYDEYDNMTREELYYYFKGKYEERNKNG